MTHNYMGAGEGVYLNLYCSTLTRQVESQRELTRAQFYQLKNIGIMLS